MPRSTKRKRTKSGMTKRCEKECDIEDKMLMNSSSKESFKQEEKTTISHLPSIKWSLFKKLSLDPAIHINEERKHVWVTTLLDPT